MHLHCHQYIYAYNISSSYIIIGELMSVQKLVDDFVVFSVNVLDTGWGGRVTGTDHTKLIS
jgi:hypothetical protein